MDVSNTELGKMRMSFNDALSHARNIFPGDQVAQDLLAKSIASSLDPEEQQRLNKLFAKKDQQKRFSPEVIDLMNRQENGDQNVVFVDMNSTGGEISISPEGSEKVIFTNGLGGCYATTLYFEQPDGSRHAILTHFDPTINPDQLSAVVVLKRATDLGHTRKSRTVLLIESPGNWVKNNEGNWKMRAQNQVRTNALRDNILRGLGELEKTPDVITEIYPAGSDTKDHGVFRLHIPSVRQGEPRYITWFSRGTLGEIKAEE
jgi:hypothetical protein